MKFASIRGLILLIGVGLVWIAAGKRAAAQQPGPVAIPATGTEMFRYGLHQEIHLQPLVDMESIFQAPKDTILVIFGETRIEQMFRVSLLNYLNQGGSVIIATDRANLVGNWGWARDLGIEISGSFVSVANPNEGYRNLDTCPFVRPIPKPIVFAGENPPHDILKPFAPNGMDGIATNNPSLIRILRNARGPGRTVNAIAGFPASAFHKDGLVVPDMEFLAVGLRFQGGGRALIIADHSIFINRMMARDDNRNYEFSVQAMKWLQGGGEKPRTHCLFLEDNRVQNVFNIPFPEKKLPGLPDLPWDVVGNLVLKATNEYIPELEEKNFFNELFLQSIGLRGLMRTFLLLATIYIVYRGIRWVLFSRTPQDVATTQAADFKLPKENSFQMRQVGMVRKDNLYEAARNRVRDRFGPLGAEPIGGMPPPILVDEFHPKADELRERILILWRIGYGSQPRRVSPYAWDFFNDDLEAVLRAAAQGKWTFSPEVPT